MLCLQPREKNVKLVSVCVYEFFFGAQFENYVDEDWIGTEKSYSS